MYIDIIYYYLFENKEINVSIVFWILSSGK